ncbi:MAG: ATP-binding cassette domain-containing protein [Ruminococcus sp.]|nr:ATP-binding cassette domain-containing protein [Ruminococcus sp.]
MDNILVTENLSKIHKSKTIIDGVNLTVNRGKTYALVGEKVAGKTTLIRLLAGIILPTSGKVNKNPEIKTSFIIERAAIFPEKSVYDNMAIGCILHNTPFSHIEPTLEKTGLSEMGKKRAGKLSVEHTECLGLALSLLSTPDFLVIDEASDKMLGLLENLNTGATILTTYDKLSDNRADEYFFLHGGKIVGQATKASLDKSVRKAVKMSVSSPDAALSILRVKLNMDADVENGYLVVPDKNLEQIKQVLNENAVRIYKSEHFFGTYEEYFKSVIGGEENG